jgi:radical SAM protein with 4Fe4S-binding SPASM domain
MQNLHHLNRIPTGISYMLRREHVWGQPVFFTIETINSCNFRCIYCPQSEPENHFVNGRGAMSFENFKHIIANLRSAFDLKIVSLHRDGEPLLNKRLEDFISHLTSTGTCVTVSSNCSLIPEQRAKSLIASGLSMVGTDFCADPELYESVRAKAVWSETLAGIRNLLAAAKEAKARFQFVIKDVATHGQPPDRAAVAMEQTRKLFAQDADRVTVMPVYFHNALGESLVTISATKPLEPPQPVAMAAAAGAGMSGRGTVTISAPPVATAPEPEINPAGTFYTLCHQPWVNLTVDWAGRVVGCCRDLRSEYIVGNLLEESAADIWNGERMKQMRHALSAKRPEDIDICKACDVPWQGSYSGQTIMQKTRNFFFSKAWAR